MTEFTVDCPIGSDRICVRWMEDKARLHFVAAINGDVMGSVRAGAFKKNPGGQIYEAVSGRTRYHDATDTRFVPIVTEARAAILNGKLATKAFAARDAERAERTAQAIRDKAEAMRKALCDIDLQGALTDGALAEAYDRIQNSAV